MEYCYNDCRLLSRVLSLMTVNLNCCSELVGQFILKKMCSGFKKVLYNSYYHSHMLILTVPSFLIAYSSSY